ncbi:coiled-coil domain-containing protein 22 isoform X1 [Sorex araneus]|uniref:coiled-coil domain-containing protein 22 isoform X1 n=1 Tax=Sorex araneus TaxID=42254 RepID=UPI002433B82B|nr:coiled-coil domain-containing protein 22 isoform X1 [Sorex araneus]
MEEADRILIHSLRQAGTEIPPEVQSLRAFNTELVVEAVVRCLRVINPPVGSSLSHLLPLAMSARFRLAMSLAQACMDLGYPLELGYQNFLYPSEPDLRDLLLFLVERLPTDTSEDADQPAGDSAILFRSIAGKLGQQMTSSSFPSRRCIPNLENLQNTAPEKLFNFNKVVMAEMNSEAELREYQASAQLLPATRQVPEVPERAASFMECHTFQASDYTGQGQPGNEGWVLHAPCHPTQEDAWAQQQQQLKKYMAEQLRQASSHPEAFEPEQDLGEMLQAWGGRDETDVPKGSRFMHSEKFTFHGEPEAQVAVVSDVLTPEQSEQPMPQDTQAAEEEELEALRRELDEVERGIDEFEAIMRALGLNIAQVESECQENEQSMAEREQALRVQSQAVELLPDGPTNLAKLQLLVESSAQRVIHLAEQWEKHRVPLLEEYRHLRQLQESRELESSRRLAEIQELHQSVRAAADEARRKEDVYKQLMVELESLPRDVSRLSYTQRILEIVGNIQKQKEEITKILSDTKELQKEINSLSGKLDRTFAVTDELVFKDAKKDDAVRKAYKYLAALHENCSQLIKTIEDTGTIMREVRDLEEQIETEMGKKTLSNLEKIREDYRALRQENANLLGRFRET